VGVASLVATIAVIAALRAGRRARRAAALVAQLLEPPVVVTDARTSPAAPVPNAAATDEVTSEPFPPIPA
jgi:hypothetical protein